MQSAKPESPELFAMQSAKPESPELFAMQSAKPESQELKAVGTVGKSSISDLEFGGLNDLFDQGDEDIETLFDNSPQGKDAILKVREESSSSLDSSRSSPERFSNESFGNQGFDGGFFDFGVDRDFDYKGGQDRFSSAITADSYAEEVVKADPSSSDGREELSIDASAIVFDMGEPAAISEPKAITQTNDELMSISVEEDSEQEREDSVAQVEIEVHSDPGEQEEEKSKESSSKQKAQSSRQWALLLVAFLIGFAGFIYTQQPELINQLIGGETGGGNIQRSARPLNRGSNSGGGQQRALGNSEATSSQLRAISSATRGKQTQNETVALESDQSSTQQAVGQNPTPHQRTSAASNTSKTNTTPAPSSQQEDQVEQGGSSAPKTSWFNLSEGLRSAFKPSELAEASAFAETIRNPSTLDAEGFNEIAQRLKEKSELSAASKAETLALGTLHFNTPNSVWARDALNASAKIDSESARTPEGERAIIATQLVHQVDYAHEHAIAVGLARPKDAKAQSLMAHAYLQRGQTQLAQEAFDRAQSLDPSDARSKQKFAELALANGNVVQAEKVLKGLLKEGLGSPVVHRTLAEVKLRTGEPEKAFGWINNLFEAPPERLSQQDNADTLTTFAKVMESDIAKRKSSGVNKTEQDETTLLDEEQAKQAALREAIKQNPNHPYNIEKLISNSVKSKNWKLALQEIQSLQAKSGGAVTLALKEVELLKKLERGDKAMNKLKEAVSQFGSDPRAHLAMGNELIQRREYAKARRSFERAREVAPGDPKPILALTDLLIKEARVKEAQSFLQHEIKQRPWSSSLHSGLGDIKLKIAQTSGQQRIFEEAKASYDQALKINPSNHSARAQRARTLLSLDAPQEALSDLEWLERQGYLGDLSFEFGQAQQALGRPKEAQQYYEKVLDQDREHLDALRSMGSIMQASKEVPKAKQYYEQALAVDPRDSETRFALGKLLLNQKDAGMAVEHLRVASEIKPQDPKFHYWHGRALQSNGEEIRSDSLRTAYESAALLINQAQGDPGELCDVHYRVGLVHSQQAKELSVALDDFTKASKCAPKRADVWTKLAGVYRKLGDQAAVMKHYETALKQNPKYIPAIIGTAREYLNQIPPQTKLAQRALDQVIKLNKNHPEATYRLCTLYQSSARRKAKSYCQRYLKLDPKGEFVESAKEIIRSL